MSKPNKENIGSLQEIEQGEFTHVTKKKVSYKIVHGWNLTSSLECDSLWKQGWMTLLKQIQRAEPDETKQNEILASMSTEDIHWDWFGKAVAYSTDEYEWFHLYADGKPQAACLIYHPKASALEPGDIFYVKFVAVAPWNRTCDLRPREFCGLGKIILRAAQRFAVKELKLRPGFCLHSLPKAEVVYKKLKMVKVDGREDAQSLAYYELPQALATQLMEVN
ncbi:MAG TPA: N-acetyltransferase [Verrucomicrobiae bacterium]|nr:N-acetyltransferase [Verrucomicrobiae bacterium]